MPGTIKGLPLSGRVQQAGGLQHHHQLSAGHDSKKAMTCNDMQISIDSGHRKSVVQALDLLDDHAAVA